MFGSGFVILVNTDNVICTELMAFTVVLSDRLRCVPRLTLTPIPEFCGVSIGLQGGLTLID